MLKIKNENKLWDVRQSLTEAGLSGKKDFTLGVFKHKVEEFLGEQSYTLTLEDNIANLNFNNKKFTILILPSKGSITLETVAKPATKFKHDNEDFNLLLNKYEEYSKIDESESKRVYKWFIKHLKNKQVTHVALTNLQLETVQIFSLEESKEWLTVILEAKPKFSGTSFYTGGTKPILYLMKNDENFKNGKLNQVSGSKRYIVENVSQLTVKDCKIGGIFFSWNGDSYDVRKQSKVSKYSLKAKFKATDKIWQQNSDLSSLK